MIRSVQLKNFKSLYNFSIELTKFNCLIGLNGAGKSTVLQGMDFIGQLMRGDISSWLDKRKWNEADLTTKSIHKPSTKKIIGFTITANLDGISLEWSGSFNTTSLFLRCTTESIKNIKTGDIYLSVKDAKYKIGDEPFKSIEFDYEGSILSQIKDNTLNDNPILRSFRDLVRSIKSLDLLSPEQMRQRARKTDEVGLGGEGLSAYIDGLSKEDKTKLSTSIKEFYPLIKKINTESIQGGWKQLSFSETFQKKILETEARHINDGTLRILTILSHLASKKRFLLFDEIENGINPEIIEKLVDKLVKADQQILVTTHSPMILNYLEDDIAKESVILLYKNKQGYTKSFKFFDLPLPAEKLDILGPGEVFVDSSIEEIISNIEVEDE